MKKAVFLSLSVFAALFIVITVTKNKPVSEELRQDGITYSDSEKEKVIQFWEHYRKATDDRMNGKWEQAVESYRDALDFNGQHEDAIYYLGNMYLELSRYKEAEECFLKLVQVNPKNSRGYLQLGSLYLSSEEFFDIDKAESACLQALKINKEETGPVLLLGEVNLIRGQLEDAASDFEAVTASNFKSTEAYFLSGYIAWKKGDRAKARDVFSLAVKNAKPLDTSPAQDKVDGEGDTRRGKGFGAVTSKSVFRKFMTELPHVEPELLDQALDKAYENLDNYLAELKRRIY